jgi:hypothetical protein
LQLFLRVSDGTRTRDRLDHNYESDRLYSLGALRDAVYDDAHIAPTPHS